jgi:hypothetical protein
MTDETIARRNWAKYMKAVHSETRKDVLRSTYETLSAMLPDPIQRSTASIWLFAYKQKDWRTWAELKQQDNKGLYDPND